MNIVVIGSINTDLVINTNRIPKIGETIMGSGFSVNCGGKGANQAIAVAKLGGNVTLLGAVGNDEFAKISIQNLKNFGVNTKGVVKTDLNTGVAVITVCDGDNSIILDSGANSLVSKELIDKNIDLILGADAVIMQLEIPIETVSYVASIAHSNGVKVILNPAPVMDLPLDLLKNTDILILNETEAEEISKINPDTIDNREKCINKLKDLSVRNIIITLGENGAVYTDNGDIKYMSAIKTNVVDTTAAGDTFIGAFCMKMNEGTEYAIKYATVASSITVSRAGASKSIPNKVEVSELMKSIE